MSTRRTGLVPKAPVARILLNVGAKRISADAVDVFADVIADIAETIGKRAAEIARHSGRKTIQEGDIRIASKQD